jgi:SAM-dependent methyltransferase
MVSMGMSDRINDNYRDAYRNSGVRTSWHIRGTLDKVRNIIRLCNGVQHQSIIEIGAGDGANLREMARQSFGSSYVGLEISSSGVEAMTREPVAERFVATLFDGYQIPYDDNKFDLAILSHVVEHLEHPRQLLAEALRVAPWVFIEVPLEDNCRATTDYLWTSTGHLNRFSSRTIRWLIQSCGGEVVSQITTNPHGKRGRVIDFIRGACLLLAPSMARYVFTYHEALLCRKAPVGADTAGQLDADAS